MAFIAQAICEFEQEFETRVADTPALIEESYRLRYQVYCRERHFLEGADGLEFDEFDADSHHIVLQSRASGDVVGCVRLVLGSQQQPHTSFPMQRLCDGMLPPGVPLRTATEVSRFAISKERRSAASTALMRLGLVRGLVEASAMLGLTHWCAVMEPSLLRLLQMTSIYFRPFGPLVEYHGLRQPCWNDLDLLLDRVAEERFELWQFLTGSGRLWQRTPVRIAVAA